MGTTFHQFRMTAESGPAQPGDGAKQGGRYAKYGIAYAEYFDHLIDRRRRRAATGRGIARSLGKDKRCAIRGHAGLAGAKPASYQFRATMRRSGPAHSGFVEFGLLSLTDLDAVRPPAPATVDPPFVVGAPISASPTLPVRPALLSLFRSASNPAADRPGTRSASRSSRGTPLSGSIRPTILCASNPSAVQAPRDLP